MVYVSEQCPRHPETVLLERRRSWKPTYFIRALGKVDKMAREETPSGQGPTYLDNL